MDEDQTSNPFDSSEKPPSVLDQVKSKSKSNYIPIDETLRQKIVNAECASIVLSVIVLITRAVFSIFYVELRDISKATYSQPTNVLLSILTFVAVIWRYSLKSNTLKKDKKTLTIISALFILSSLFIEIESITNLIVGVTSLPNYLFIVLSSLQFFLFFLIGTYKYHLATLLNNNTVLMADCITSLANAVYVALFGVSMIFNFYFYVWYLSSIFSILIGIFMLIYGGYLLMKIFYWKDMDILIEGFIP